jgi:AcrR family transcriptional regulator
MAKRANAPDTLSGRTAKPVRSVPPRRAGPAPSGHRSSSAMHATPQPARKRGRPPKGESATLRQELIAASARLFREQGYEKTTVRDIAAATGTQAGSWFYHFKTKQDILAAVMEEGMTNSLARLEQLGVEAMPPREAFRALIHTHLNTIVSPNHDFIPVLLYEWRSLEPQTRKTILALKDRYERIWDAVIARLRVDGDWVSPTPIDRLLMFGALNWVVQWYRPKGKFDIDAMTDHAVAFFLRS